MSRVALYVRVSTEEQQKHGLSVDSQIQALNEYAKANNHTVVGLYNDAGISARKTYKKRPALLRLMEDTKAGKIDLILFTKLDRWFRSVGDYYEVQRVLDDNKVCWRTIWEDYETETSSGVFKVNIMLSVAQSEADRTSERIKSVNEYKRARGEVCTGGVSTGYVIKDKRWYIDKEKEPAVRAFFDTYLETFSLKLASKAYEAIGGTLSSNVASRFLRKPCYYGGEPYVAEAYITEAQHKIIEPTIKSRGRSRVYHHLFNGLIYCTNCGGMLTPSAIRPDRSQYHCRYFCNKSTLRSRYCIGASIREDFLEEYLLDNLDTELNKYSYDVKLQESNNKISDDIKSVKKRLTRLKNLYELGDMDFNEYKEKRALLLENITALEAQLSSDVPVELPNNWKEVYEELDVEHRRIFWSKIIKRIEVSDHMSTKPLIIF